MTAEQAGKSPMAPAHNDIATSATFLRLEPGFYAVEFRGSDACLSDVGLPIPCARLDPMPAGEATGRIFVTTIPEGGWLSHLTQSTHVLVIGTAAAVLTTYRFADRPPPEVKFRFLMAPDKPPEMLVHAEALGDMTGPIATWIGDPDDMRGIEGFSITLPGAFAADDLQFQAIMGLDWRTPWSRSGEFCGSRGLQLPLGGFCLRLAGPAADRLDCRAWGRFGAGHVVGPVGSGEDCVADDLPLRAMKIEFVAKRTD